MASELGGIAALERHRPPRLRRRGHRSAHAMKERDSCLAIEYSQDMLSWVLFRPTFRVKSFPRFQSVLVDFSRFFSQF